MLTNQPLNVWLQKLHYPGFVKSCLASVGGLWILFKLCQLASFVRLHFLHSGTLERYKETRCGKQPWAIITGASDGVGKGFAEELLDRGFNIVLHGRNEMKLRGIVDKLSEQWPQRAFRLLILDAFADVRDSEKIQMAVEQLKDLELKVLINNVGGNGGEGRFLQLIEEQSASSVDTWWVLMLKS
jgi:hypothetical protein